MEDSQNRSGRTVTLAQEPQNRAASSLPTERDQVNRPQLDTASACWNKTDWPHLVFRESLAAESVADLSGKMCAVNPAFLRLWGYSEESAVLGMHVSAFFAWSSESEPVLAALRETGSWEGEFIAERRDGTHFDCRGFASLLRTDPGEPLGYFSTNLDVTAQRRMEASLRASEERYQLLADFTLSWDYWLSTTGEIVYCSPSCEGMTGYRAEEFVAEPALLLRVVHPDDREAITIHRQAAEFDGETSGATFRVIHKDGSLRWLSHTCRTIRDSLGTPRGRRCSDRDITAEYLARQALERDHGIVRALLESANMPIFAVDQGYRYLCFNQSHANVMRELYGQQISPGQSLLDCMTVPEDQELARKNLARAPLGEHFTIEAYSGDDERTRSPFEVVHGPICGSDGLVLGASVYVRDVTESCRAWQAANTAREFMRGIIDSLSEHVCVLDATGHIVEVNRAWRMFALDNPPAPPDAWLHANYLEICDKSLGDDRGQAHAFADGIRQVLARRLHAFELEYPCHSPHRERWFMGRVTPFLDSNQHVVVAHTDITSQKRLMTQLSQADRLATMGMLAAGVAHEINNPLAYVLYNLESIQESAGHLLHSSDLTTVDLADCAERLEDALGGALRIRDIVRGLGTFSRVEHGQKTALDIRIPIQHALDIAHNELKYRARVVAHLSPVPPVLASEGSLAQVVLNLLVNAGHAIGSGKIQQHQITVGTHATQNLVVITVSDTGPGIPLEHQPRIFDPFFTTKAVGEGSGLGLPICRNIVESFGGHIAFESELGRGTTFWVRLPICRSENTTSSRPEPPASLRHEPTPRGRLLAVDDDPGVLRMLAHMLGSEHEVLTAASGAEACQKLTADPRFDLLLFDVMMPQLSGIELHAWVCAHHPALAERVVFITGGAFTAETRTRLAELPNARLDKPFEQQSLRALVRAQLTR